MEYKGIIIDPNRDSLIDKQGMQRLKESYMREDEVSPQERFAYVSKKMSSNPEHAQRLYDYASKHWLSYSTPILSYGRTDKGLPISCFLVWLDDTSEGLVDTSSETKWLSMIGGGIGIGVGIRPADDKSTGVLAHLKGYDADTWSYRQGKTRRGSTAAYLDIEHPDVTMFTEIRKPTGDPNLRCPNIHNGINIPNKFMELVEQAMIDPHFDDTWELKLPQSGKVVDTISAKYLWQKILETRMQTGEPYLHFIDNTNDAVQDFLKATGYEVRQSNLCITGDSMILITEDPENGPYEKVKISDLVEQYELGRYDSVYVRSYNFEKQMDTWELIENGFMTKEVEELIEIETSDGNIIRCTLDHLIYTENRGWVEAQDLLEEDDIKTLNF